MTTHKRKTQRMAKKKAPKEAAPSEPTTEDIPINKAQAKLFQQIEAGLVELVGKRDAGLLVLLAGVGFDAGTFELLGFDFEKGTVRVQLPASQD